MIRTKIAMLTAAGTTTVIGGGIGVYLLSKDKTIEDKLIRNGKDLINTIGDYEIAFIERKEDQKLIKILNNIGLADTAKAGEALQKWCEENQKLKLNKENIENTLPKVEKYCIKPSKTIEERYKKLNKKLIEGGGWKEKIIELKKPKPEESALEKDLKLKSLGQDQDNSKSAVALENWCNKQIKMELSKDKSETTWKKVIGRCLQA